MSILIDFLKNNYGILLSVSAFIISLINLIYLLITNKKRLTININNYTFSNVNNRKFYMFNVEFINKSRLPISVNEIIIESNKEKYKIIKSPRMLSEKDRKQNGLVIKHQEIHSAKFPINILGLTSEHKFIVMYGPDRIDETISTIIINTNRGKITKKVLLNNYYVKIDEFTKEASEYYD